MKENPLRKLHALGQSIWLDYIRRDRIPLSSKVRSPSALENEGVVQFTTPFDKLLATLLQMARSNRRAVIS